MSRLNVANFRHPDASSDSISLNSSGGTSIGGLAFPTSDGTDGQFLTTNGSGTISFVTNPANTTSQFFTVTGKQTQTSNVLSTTSFSNVREGSDSFSSTAIGNLNKVWEVTFTPTAGKSNALIRVLLNSYAEEINDQDYLGALLCVRHGTTWSHIDCSWQGSGSNEMGEGINGLGVTNDAYDHVWFVNRVSTTNLNRIAIALFSNINTTVVLNDIESTSDTHTVTEYTSVMEVVEH